MASGMRALSLDLGVLTVPPFYVHVSAPILDIRYIISKITAHK